MCEKVRLSVEFPLEQTALTHILTTMRRNSTRIYLIIIIIRQTDDNASVNMTDCEWNAAFVSNDKRVHFKNVLWCNNYAQAMSAWAMYK